MIVPCHMRVREGAGSACLLEINRKMCYNVNQKPMIKYHITQEQYHER